MNKEKIHISQAVNDFLTAVWNTSSIEIVEASAEDLTKLEKWGIKKTDDISVIKGTYLHVDKANRNGHFLSRATVDAGLKTIVGKPMNIFHKRENPKGFYFDAEIVDTAMVTKAIFWKALFPEDYANIEIWVKAGVAGQSFELKYGKATFRKNDQGQMEIDITDVTFVGGAILPKDKAADRETNLEVIAKELSTKYPDLVFAFVKPEEEDGSNEEDAAKQTPVKPEESDDSNEEDAKLKELKKTEKGAFALSYQTIQELLWLAQCPKCQSDGGKVLMIDFQNSIAKLECYRCEKEFKVSFDVSLKKAEVSEFVDEKEDKITQLTTQLAGALEQLKVKIYSQVDVDAKIKEAADIALKMTKEAVDAREKEINLKHEEEKTKESRLAELDKIKTLTSEERSSIDVSSAEKFELAKIARENELLKSHGLSVGGNEHTNDKKGKGDPNME